MGGLISLFAFLRASRHLRRGRGAEPIAVVRRRRYLLRGRAVAVRARPGSTSTSVCRKAPRHVAQRPPDARSAPAQGLPPRRPTPLAGVPLRAPRRALLGPAVRPGAAISARHAPRAVNVEHHRWHSPALDRDMSLLVFGHGGARVLVFPTSLGTCSRVARPPDARGARASTSSSGWIQLFCLDQVHDGELVRRAPASRRPGLAPPAVRPLPAERGAALHRAAATPTRILIATGASFGAYHAACFGFRHPAPGATGSSA